MYKANLSILIMIVICCNNPSETEKFAINAILADHQEVDLGATVTLELDLTRNSEELEYDWQAEQGFIGDSALQVTWRAPLEEGSYGISCRILKAGIPLDSATIEIMVTDSHDPLGRWFRSAALPYPRQELIGGAVLDDKIYVVGGMQSDGEPSDNMQIFDPATNQWSIGPNLPVRRHHLSVAAVGGKLYAIGGVSVATFWTPEETTYEYDPATETWTEKAPMISSRMEPAPAVYNGKIYLFGGRQRGGISQRTADMYDPITDTWTALQAMPTIRQHAAAAVVDTLIYVVGGRYFEEIEDPNLSGWLLVNNDAFEIYDPTTDSWSRGAPLPTARGALAAATVDKRIYAFGGEYFPDGTATSPGTVFDVTEMYDPALGVWTTLAPMPIGHHAPSVTVLDDIIYLIGGASQAGLAGTSTSNQGFMP
jgi:N-acetylneuraminic acid mutarotase